MYTYTYTCVTCGKAFQSRRLNRKTCSYECRDLKRRSAPEIFWERVQKNALSECWPWLGFRDKPGYGRLSYQGQMISAHRLAWQLHNSQLIPPGKCVLHSCDNPPCCNPAHLRVGTLEGNNADRAAKNRGNRPIGEANPKHKMTWADVREIRRLYSTKQANRVALAATYNVWASTISDIVKMRTWIE